MSTDVNESMFPGWAIVEVMGHNRFAGYVSQEIFAGLAFIRIDVPETESTKAFTKLVGPSSIFGITPCSEEVARRAVNAFRAAPHYLIDIDKPGLVETNTIAPVKEDDNAIVGNGDDFFDGL